ncbi:nitrous oxidase accessory protein [Malaciobacter mytili]|uniref:Nitrous oxidase accessory protein n=2 Tax=Malaciobacter TaxID=2321114 RepID=A0AAX2AIV7_9BACT|nr:nitrous oxide reductase family maturation protein NosD [Malaciobacter mytili]AXH15698.1 copper ABC transporter NosDFY, periplasmic copper-binding protein NosD [Malaciobacter mytili LMG 24559]RXI44833.1 nitrous oxidase accessory protein [Malaciobacter mytili]RXK16116.1 nitrous oxidase accessory protein [Malaciobacter mytili LMG 24559]
MKQLLLVICLTIASFASPLQEAINKASEGSIIQLQKGEYYGNIVINKPLTIDGLDKSAKIVGDGKGTVITINSSNVTLKNLTIKGSGSSHEKIDSAILAQNVNNIKIKNNHIEDSLFGINFQKVNRSLIIDNFITSKNYDLGLRGDAIRLWYSHDNQLLSNKIYKSRDFVIWYSSGNVIEQNHGSYNRYSLHFMYAGRNLVQNNLFEHSSVGIFFMYSSGTTAINNTIKNSTGAFGVGIGMKDSSNFTLIDNKIIYNARGIYIDQSPFQPNTTNIYKNNKILYNSSAIQFQALREKNIFQENIIKGNMEPIVNDSPRNNLSLNLWHRNYWDNYEGFDRNKDGVGDIPFNHYIYADKLWLYNPNVKFFYGSVVIDLLNFLAKFAPFSEPSLLASDNEPLIQWSQKDER